MKGKTLDYVIRLKFNYQMNEILNFIALLLLFICKYQLMSRNIVCD